MPAIIIYLLKSIVCSGILYAYYRMAFYNRVHHQWNRFYLLTAMLVSLLLPLVKIYIPGEVAQVGSQVIRLMNVVATNELPEENMAAEQTATFNPVWLLFGFYIIVSSALVFLLIKSLVRISKLYHSSPKQKFDQHQLVMTEEKDAPFSFLRTIFWNTRIDLDSSSGSRIFQHEMEHVRQLHSIDRLFMNMAIALFWCNPFYWLIRKELIVVHEFIADKKAIHDNDEGIFSEMVLLSVFHGKDFGLTSAFFNSSIKRRLTMLTTFKNSKTSLLAKWLLLPVMLIMFAGFSLRKKDILAAPIASTFVLMVDAGHGGERTGISAADGTKEKDLNLAIAKKIKDLNTDSHIKIVLTREGDEDLDPRARVESAKKAGVNAFLSIHINNDQPTASGVQLYISRNANEYTSKSQLLGSLMSQELKKVYKVDGDLRKGRENGQGVWVLDAPEINYPSLLIECGNINNSADFEFLKSPGNQEKLARQIMNAVTRFANGVAQAAPKGIEILVEKGKIYIELKDNKVVKSDFSQLKSLSSKNIFIGDDVKSNGNEVVIMDGIYLANNSKKIDRLELGANQKLIIVSTKGEDPMSTLMN